ncbi:MAG TPA: rhodanese-like domain-containing protein [Pyrinomonadaceae bacterium]|nr:rhodanese-like domain-containing protein [Pyrinomonadaceae bacterium]
MRPLTFSITALALAGLLAACSSIHSKSTAQQAVSNPNVTATPYPDGARRITIDELEAMMKDGKAFVVDVRNQDSYDAGHIPGAKLIPSGEILNHLDELPKDKLIVTYCS